MILFITLAAPCVWAQGIKRTDKMPGFFVPKGALNTQPRTEQLPPVSTMQYRGQQAQIVQEMQQQEREKARLAEEEKQKQQRIAEHKAKMAENKKRLKVAEPAPTTVSSGVPTPREDKFAQIIAEYHSDIKAIGQGKAVHNQRLINMIADYKNLEHSI